MQGSGLVLVVVAVVVMNLPASDVGAFQPKQAFILNCTFVTLSPPPQVGYLAREAPLRTWLPLLLCTVLAAAGAAMARRQFIWAAVGGTAAFLLTLWQVAEPCGLARMLCTLWMHACPGSPCCSAAFLVSRDNRTQ